MPSALRTVVEGRDLAVREIAQFFDYGHLPPELQDISREVHDTAVSMVQALPDSTELSVGLRKLVEAKDCFVRAAVAARQVLPIERCPVLGSHPGHEFHSGNPQGVKYQIPPPDAKLVWCRGETVNH